MKQLFWLDTDIGNDTDDYYALSYLLARPEVELCGVSTVTAAAGVRVALARMAIAAAGKQVPVFAGAERPFRRTEGIPCRTPTPEGSLPPAAPYLSLVDPQAAEPGDAVEAMRAAIEAHPHELTLVAIGPLSNLANLFTAYPHTANLLRRLVMMGGCYADTMPAPWRTVEWNIRMDPYAAAAVFAADLPECLVAGLEETARYECESARFAEATAASPALAPNVPALLAWGRLIRFHDVVPLLPLFAPCGTVTERGDIRLLTAGDSLGKTVFTPSADGRFLRIHGGDVSAFFLHLADIFGYRW